MEVAVTLSLFAGLIGVLFFGALSVLRDLLARGESTEGREGRDGHVDHR